MALSLSNEQLAALSSPVAVGVGGVIVGAGLGATAVAIAKRKKSKNRVQRKRIYSHSRKRHKQKQPYTARKRKDTSHRRIRYTKNNQPYIILSSGKARFIKKSSVRSSRKLKGGRY